MNSVPSDGIAQELRVSADRLVKRGGKRRFSETAQAMKDLAIGIELGLSDAELWKRDCAYQKLLFNAARQQ